MDLVLKVRLCKLVRERWLVYCQDMACLVVWLASEP